MYFLPILVAMESLFCIVLLLFGYTSSEDDATPNFMSIKLWPNRRQLLIHEEPIWVREVVAWEAIAPSYGYILREVTNGRQLLSSIFDENYEIRNCGLGSDKFSIQSAQRLIRDLKRSFQYDVKHKDSFQSLVPDPELFRLLLGTANHASSTFDEISKHLNLSKSNHTNETISFYKRNLQSKADAELFKWPFSNQGQLDSSAHISFFKETISSLKDNLGATSYLRDYFNFEVDSSSCQEYNKMLQSANLLASEDHSLSGANFEDKMTVLDADAIPVPGTLNVDEVKHRQERGLFMFPGTLWCGTGNRATSTNGLGKFNMTDACCREHDHCPVEYQIDSQETKYNFKNWGMYTISHCRCDKRFHKCLRQVRSEASYEVGRGFFNVFNIKCFVIRKRKKCKRVVWYMPWSCAEHEYADTACLRNSQAFPSKKYIWPK